MQHVFFITKTYTLYHIPFNPNMCRLFRDFFCGGGKNTPFLKHIRIMLQSWNLERKYRNICCFRKYTFYYQDPLNFVDANFFCKISAFFGKSSTWTQRAVLEIFSSVFSFCKIKVVINKNLRITDHASEFGFRIAPDWP